ncbi:3-oxoacyl-[acyl-carrier-protein] synthase III C-terminal domain-containing protein [Dactylosporangium sp. NPDC000244]|uniref:3-oxoacyl-[acyl-carrier-protein] synthase III C-terminal domain-containing protein n=1 Tax=Dactylosporangium sp. NPDC000244 TaxID=3154365 RepID=UPI00332EBA0C
MGQTVYITGCGSFLPGAPVGNDEIADRLGGSDRATARRRARVLAANGIRQRYYAVGSSSGGAEADGELDGTREGLGNREAGPGLSNEELAAAAVERAVKDAGLALGEIGMLATGTTMGDQLVPGFAAMVHGRVGGGPMELLSAGGVCASGMAALKAAAATVALGEHDAAVVVGSELVSRVLAEPRFGAGGRVTADAEFLRWTLSDGAGAVVLSSRPRTDRASLRVEWVRSVSYAHEYPACMRAGEGWLDAASAAEAEAAGALRLRQDVGGLPGLVRLGVEQLRELVDIRTIDHALVHYSANTFRDRIFREMPEIAAICFSNLDQCGNTGAASIFVMLEEAWRTQKFKPGDRILLAVPESGRFTIAFALLTCVGPAQLLDDLAEVWGELEERLAGVPLVRRIEDGTATISDYRALLVNLRQQVVEGGRWISRAASSFSAERFELRSAAIRHAAEEHRDFRLLERDFVAVGGDLAEITAAAKNPGSEALSAFILQQASLPDPVDLLGAMFVIEGLGGVKALGWARMLQERLGLTDEQVSFLRYHGQHDGDHLSEMHRLLGPVMADPADCARIVRTARITARLYALQLEEIQ